MFSYLNAISFEFFTGNFKATNKKRVSKCSSFKCLHLGHKTFVKRKYFYCYFCIFVLKVINFANLYYKISRGGGGGWGWGVGGGVGGGGGT